MESIKVSLQPKGLASSPLLIHVNQISYKSQSRAQCIVYYQIPLSFKYQSTQKLLNKDLFLPDCRLSYKIVNFVKKTEEIVEDNTELQIKSNNNILLTNKTKEGTIEIKGTIINQAKQSNVFADISLKKIEGYDKFYEYRKKFKTLENITRKIEFSLDHRIKLLCEKVSSKEDFFFSMDELKDKQVKNWYIELVKNTKVTVFFQQIVKIGDESFEKTIEQGSFYFDNITWDNSYELVLEMSQYLKTTFALKLIKNKNLSKFQFVALRVFETSYKDQTIKIGNEQTINSLSGCIELNPLLQGKYYDLEYGYLSQNLKELQGMGQEEKLHKYLQRLTSSKQKYQHFINQKVLDLSGCKNLVFMVNENFIQIPVTYLLEGYNSFGNENVDVKFLLEVEEDRKPTEVNEQELTYQQFKPIPRKLYEIKVEDLLNIAQIPTIMQKVLFSTEKSFYLKIKCESIIYTAEFEISTVKRADFKKESKQLELKTEYSKFVDGSFVLLTPTQNKDNALMIKSRNLQDFYLLQLTDTTPVTFTISTKRHVMMNGQIPKSYFYSQGSSFKTKAILSPNGMGNNSQKSVLCLDVKEIPQQIQGYSFNYKIKYRVSAEKTQNFSSVYYDLQVVRVQEEDLKKNKKKRVNKDRLADKVQLQIENGNAKGTMMKEFSVNRSCFVQKHSNILLGIRLKKMHYNIDMKTFDNDAIIQKSLLLNRGPKDLVKQGTLTSQLPAHHFREYEFEAYDENIKQKVTLNLEIYCSKQPFSIGEQHLYHVKVPAMLWKMNSLVRENQPKPKIQIETFLSSKKNKEKLKGELVHNSAQQVLLGHFNASDGISVKVTYQNGESIVGYSKIRDCIKAKCQIAQDQIGWIEDSEWYFAVLNMQSTSFFFLIKMQFNANAERQSSNESRATQKTKSKERKQSSNEKGGPDLLAKTMKGFDVITKLKFNKNNLQDEFRQLTAKYVQRQETIVKLKKKIAELDEQNRKKQEEIKSAMQINKKGQKQKSKLKKDQTTKPSLYRSICECGQRNPQFMGYCGKCLQKLRQRYELFFVEYQQKSAQYQKAMFQKFNLRDKIETLKSKISAYKDLMNGGEDNPKSQVGHSVQKEFSKMEEKHLTLEIEQLKLEIFDLERQRQSEFERRSYQMNELEKKIKKEDGEMWEKSQQLNRLHLKLSQIKQQINENTKSTNDDD